MSEIQARETAPDVVVGVDGTPASVAAVRYGLQEARASGGRLRLVHVLPELKILGSARLPLDEQLVSAGQAILRRAWETVERRPGDPEAELVLLRGRRVPTLTDTARGARVLVLGADRHHLPARVLTGNTTGGVAGSSLAPTVSVPESWNGDREDSAPVVVGVKQSSHAHELLGSAFATAQEWGRRLVVLHAWRMPSEYDDVIALRVSAGEWEQRALAEMETMVAEWRPAFPGVDVYLEVVHGQAAHALVEVSQSAHELILLPRAAGLSAASYLGPTARAVLRAAHCPVRVVPPGLLMDAPDALIPAG